MSLLRVEQMSLSIGPAPVLRGVSFDIRAGECFGLIGESGSGKSMSAMALLGLAPARATGRALFEGADLLAASERRLQAVRGARIGMVFQEPMTALNPLQTIGAQVAETVRIHGAANARRAREIARETLERVGLPERQFPLSRYPHELSGGQRQRVGIAMAVALRPALLIADEPTTALDVTTQARILKLLMRLVAQDGMALLLITHDLGVVAAHADRIAVMRDGEVVERGAAAEALSRPAHAHTRALVAASRPAPKHRRAPVEGPPLLEVREALRIHRGPRPSPFGARPETRALDGVSLTVGRGERVALVGESGCGKSTLARAILGLEPIQGGEIRIGGAPMPRDGRAPPALRRRVQAVFQDPYGSFDPRWRVGDLVAEPFHLMRPRPARAAQAARVAEVLRAVGLPEDSAQRHIHAFSGGQRQRIAIARALAIAPDLVILDEATSALDLSIRAQILSLVAELSERLGAAFLIIAHDLAAVRAVADRVLVMRAGRIVEDGPTEALFAAPRDAYTRALLAAAPDLATALARRNRSPAA